MEPQSESIANMSIKETYESMEVVIPDKVKYCPYTGSYEEMIHKAMKDKNLSVVRSLIEYRDAMNKRDKKVKELFNKSHDIRSKVTDFITSDEELDNESDYDPGYSLTDSDEEEDDDDEKMVQVDQSYYRHVDRHVEQERLNASAIIFQKHFRGYEVRRYLYWYIE